MPSLIKVVAMFLLLFALFDVCTPERCDAQEISGQTQTQFQVSGSSNSGNSCQFEEDCFNCAQYAPGAAFTLEPLASVSSFKATAFAPALAGILLVPYHPPRA